MDQQTKTKSIVLRYSILLNNLDMGTFLEF